MNARKLFALALVLVLAAGMLFANAGQQSSGGGAATAYNLPRNETLYFNGLQWGAPRGNNPYGANTGCAFTTDGHRQTMYETLFLFNQLDNKMYPQIADSYAWSGQTLTVQLNPNVKFSDGSALTSADVVYCFELSKTYAIGASGMWDYLDSVAASGPTTVTFRAKSPFNPGAIEAQLCTFKITPRAYWEGKIRDGDLGRGISDLAAFTAWDLIGSGPYSLMYYDDVKLVMIRNDNYWGQHRSRYGKLPAPKYLAHNIYSTNAVGDAAMRRGEIDVSQQFVASINTYFDVGVRTYIPQAPYYIPGTIPMIVFNTQRPGLDDKAVRKAIAMALDYDMIGTNAMSGYTAPKQPHLMLPTPAEQALIDLDALRPHMWSGQDINGANALLDQAGWVRGADGIRAKGGVRLSFRVECPEGWSDWNAALEVVAQAGSRLGMDITTYFPQAPIWTDDLQSGNFDIIMNSPPGPGMDAPWNRARWVMSSDILSPPGQLNLIGNFGRWQNARATALVNELASETTDAGKKRIWTELNQIYLDEMPAVGLMYRPWLFHQVGTTVWTGFPTFNDGSNIPPQIMIDGYGIRGLYNLSVARR